MALTIEQFNLDQKIKKNEAKLKTLNSMLTRSQFRTRGSTANNALKEIDRIKKENVKLRADLKKIMPSVKEEKTMSNLTGPYGRNFPEGPPQSRATKNISTAKDKGSKSPSITEKKDGVVPASGRGTPNQETRRLLKKQAEDRLDNPELGYEQFGGLEIGDEEPLAQKTNRSRFKSRLSSPPTQRGKELAENARVNREANLKNVDDDQDMNALEKLVSRIVGKNIRFEDIPEDDPFITNMPQNYQNLRRGGQVKRMGHGGAITPEQKKRISRIVQENKARKSKSTKATPTATTSKKRAAPFSDMKKARMNGNKKRTNR